MRSQDKISRQTLQSHTKKLQNELNTILQSPYEPKSDDPGMAFPVTKTAIVEQEMLDTDLDISPIAGGPITNL